MKIDVITIFPDYLTPLSLSLVGRAVQSGLVDLGAHDLRTWTHDRHRTVDDTPYGGGAGMVMRPEPWGEALDAVATSASRLIVFTPSGRPFTQALAGELAGEEHLVLACGRYEGIDARVVADAATRMRTEEVSIGDYVLNGGEAAALVVVEAVVRLLPGVIGNPESLAEESHSAGNAGLLEYPVYTKPPSWRGRDVPEVLFSGHHAQIAGWRRDQAVALTRQRRPELLPPDQQPVLIEPATDADAGEVWTIEKAAYLTEGVLHRDLTIPPLTETLDELRAAMSAGPFLVARIGRRVVGSVRAELREDGTWFVQRLMVAPDQERRGIGGRLLDAIEQLAPEAARRYRLTAGGNSTGNLAFYHRRGYREVERLGGPDEVPLLVLQKDR